ncbi:bifunctional pyr operon transcriptional regulator/uracil phosphoribosyltransferase PyrR [Acaryochloris sp. IP29b_bin.137]|uniref:bifunctional pyr operon transcriptional regulator/uracil phosphoribosyltransferase PyrR n=1 Tax=Acaryochloris sp. IP29b_bin.137 TaxID=2969217 RepID=UPI00261C4B99|nr:bifunctional pyr operon transcriptional regulator/uracil phosphoribosyltransferase PyrR [Acaryochloris sp. IP29b_bin.137]
MSSDIVEILSAQALRRTITRLASEVIERIGTLDNLVLLGIPTRGVPLAAALAQQIESLEHIHVPVGSLDITFYRDDLDQITVRTPGRTDLPTDLSQKNILLVDDVIYSGRTIRAALNAVHDYGRPTLIQLLVLIDRGHRELPIHPDFTGKALPTAREEQVNVYFEQTDQRDGVELVTRER